MDWKFFSGYPDKTVDKERFLNHFRECMNQKESGEMYWQALIETQEKRMSHFMFLIYCMEYFKEDVINFSF